MRYLKLICNLLFALLCVKPFLYVYGKGIIRLVVYCDIRSDIAYNIIVSAWLAIISLCLFLLISLCFFHKLLRKSGWLKAVAVLLIVLLLPFQAISVSLSPLRDGEEQDGRAKVLFYGCGIFGPTCTSVMAPDRHAVFCLFSASHPTRPYESFDLADTGGSLKDDVGVMFSLKSVPSERFRLCLQNNSYESLRIIIDGDKEYVVPIDGITFRKDGRVRIHVKTGSEEEADSLWSVLFFGIKDSDLPKQSGRVTW